MIGNLHIPGHVLAARQHRWKHRRQQIVGAHPLDRRRHLLPSAKTQQRQRPPGIPSPARREKGRGQHGLLQHLPHAVRVEKMEDVRQRKAVLLAQRNIQAVVGRRRLQFEVERPAEPLAQRQSPGLVDPRPERRMNHQLHAAAFVEEALGDDRRLRGHGVQQRAPRRDVLDRLLGARVVQPALALSQLTASRTFASSRAIGCAIVSGMNALILSRSSPTWAESSSDRPGASPRQNGMFGGAPCASSTSTLPDCTRRMRQEVLPSSMMSPARLSTAKSSSTVPTTVPSGCAITLYSAVSGIAPPLVMAASRLPRRARTDSVHAVAVQVGRVAPARSRDALGKHLDDFVEVLTLQIAIGVRPPHKLRTARLPSNPRRRTRPQSAAPECPAAPRE